MTHSKNIPYAVAVLVLGIVSIPTCVCFGIIGLTCAIIALVMYTKGINEYRLEPEIYDSSQLGMMKAGKICAIIGLILSVLYMVYFILMLTVFNSDLQEFLQKNPNL